MSVPSNPSGFVGRRTYSGNVGYSDSNTGQVGQPLDQTPDQTGAATQGASQYSSPEEYIHSLFEYAAMYQDVIAKEPGTIKAKEALAYLQMVDQHFVEMGMKPQFESVYNKDGANGLSPDVSSDPLSPVNSDEGQTYADKTIRVYDEIKSVINMTTDPRDQAVHSTDNIFNLPSNIAEGSLKLEYQTVTG